MLASSDMLMNGYVNADDATHTNFFVPSHSYLLRRALFEKSAGSSLGRVRVLQPKLLSGAASFSFTSAASFKIGKQRHSNC